MEEVFQNSIPNSVLGIPKDELISSSSSALRRLLNIISNPNSHTSISDKKIACIYISRLIGDSTEEVMNSFLNSLKIFMTEPEFKDRYMFFFSTEYYKFNSYITQHLHEYYFKSFPEPLLYKILSAGYLLEYSHISESFRNELENYLINLAKTDNLSTSIKAECADILKRIGRDYSTRSIGNDVISSLSFDTPVRVRGLDNIYMNKQNVHDVMESALDTLRQIETTEFKTNSLTDIKNELLSINEEVNEKIEKVINRISIDPSRFDGYTLPTILYMVWSKILLNPDLKRRLCEEILEMDETCSSGYFVRLMNVFSGGEFSGVKISVETELRSAVQARLNSCLEYLGSDTKEIILNEMIGKGSKETLSEFIERYSPKDELEKEYANLLLKDEFERLYQKALNDYIGGT